MMLFAVAWLVRDEHVTRDGKLCEDARRGHEVRTRRRESGSPSSHDGFMTIIVQTQRSHGATEEEELDLFRSHILIVCDVLGRYVKESLEYRSY